MENEKRFTFDVRRIGNGYLVYHDDKIVYREYANKINEYIESVVKSRMIDHVIEHYPKGTAQRLVVTVGVSGKVMD